MKKFFAVIAVMAMSLSVLTGCGREHEVDIPALPPVEYVAPADTSAEVPVEDDDEDFDEALDELDEALESFDGALPNKYVQAYAEAMAEYEAAYNEAMAEYKAAYEEGLAEYKAAMDEYAQAYADGMAEYAQVYEDLLNRGK